MENCTLSVGRYLEAVRRQRNTVVGRQKPRAGTRSHVCTPCLKEHLETGSLMGTWGVTVTLKVYGQFGITLEQEEDALTDPK